MAKAKILYIEDELFLGKIVKESLESRDFDVQMYEDGLEIQEKYNTHQPDLCILDVMLPHKGGFEIGKEIREFDGKIPIIFLTAKNQTHDVIQGFHVGGNDYIKKPFSMEELILRIENLLLLTDSVASNPVKSHLLEIGIYTVDPIKMEIKWGEEVKRLSHREMQVLKILYENRGHPVDRREILNEIWGDDHFFNSRNLDVYIRKLRQYLSEDDNVQLITLKGVGYQFVVTG